MIRRSRVFFGFVEWFFGVSVIVVEVCVDYSSKGI